MIRIRRPCSSAIPRAFTQSFGSRQLDTDEIEGRGLTRFVTFLLQLPPLLPAKWPLPPGAKLYLHHRREDSDFVGMVIEALEQFQAVEAVYPAFDGPSNDVAALHLKRLAECDAVVLCWAVAPEVWIRAEADLLRDWHRLNRSGQFAYRGVIAGPPPHDRRIPGAAAATQRNRSRRRPYGPGPAMARGAEDIGGRRRK